MRNYTDETPFEPARSTPEDSKPGAYPMRDYIDEMNPAPRCPVILLLDTSGSMRGEPIQELNQALRQFVDETSCDEAASMSVELEILSLRERDQVVLPFTVISEVNAEAIELAAAGGTFTGAALTKALEDMQARRDLYAQKMISSYRPWVILMTDGKPGDNWQAPARELCAMATKGRIQYIGIEIGSQANHDIMRNLVPREPGPLRLEHVHFKRFFRWVTDSLGAVSRSSVGDENRGLCCSWKDLL